MNEDLKIDIIGISIFIFFILGFQFIKISVFDNIPSEVYVEGELVYEGSSAGFDVESSGYATKIVIFGGFLYFFPQEVYVSKDVIIEGTKYRNKLTTHGRN